MVVDGSVGESAVASPDADVILRHIADALVLLNDDGTVLYANEAFSAVVGRSATSVLGLRWPDLVDHETCTRLDPLVTSAAEGEIHFNIDLRAPGGERKTYCVTTSEVRDEAGRRIGVLQSFRSMDRLRDMMVELKDVNDAIRRERDRADSAIDSIADGVFTVDRDLVIRSFSAKMEQLTGISAVDAIGRSCPEVLGGSKCDDDCPLRWTLVHGAVVDRCRELLRGKGNRSLPVTVTTMLLYDARGEVVGLTGVIRDESEVEQLRRELHSRYGDHKLIGRSPAMRELHAAIETLGATDTTVLITGETGTGKELVAQAIHHASVRRDRPFVSVSCAALNDNLLESELFGHVRGAFTGAVTDRAGRFEAAAGGTIFLDEIGATSASFQAKLLRFLQDKSFERVGDPRTRHADIRVIAATNRDLRRMAQEGRFREVLYYRLADVPVHVPALRDRREDIPLLVEHFIARNRPRYFAGREEQFKGISNRALALLLQYDWPGNVRELEHAIEYAMISTTENRIERDFLPPTIRQFPTAAQPSEPVVPTVATEAEQLRAALEQYRWNESRTARALGISRTTLWRRMRRAGLSK